MCLFVESLPYSPKDAIVLKTKKELLKSLDEKTFYTPFAYYKIPKNGLILSRQTKINLQKLYFHQKLRSECVHSVYTTKKGFYEGLNLEHNSYAIGIVAYEKNYVGSIALYVPDADFISTKKEKNNIKKYLESKDVKLAEVLNFFPRLNSRINYFKQLRIKV